MDQLQQNTFQRLSDETQTLLLLAHDRSGLCIDELLETVNQKASTQEKRHGLDDRVLKIMGSLVIYEVASAKPSFLEILLNANPSLARNKFLFSDSLPLHLCSNKEGIELLVKMFPESLDAKNIYGMTPLHTAAKRGSLIAVETLLGLGADSSILDNRRQKPIDLAMVGDPNNRSYQHIVRLLEGGGFTKSAMKC
jgi:hypothetical protein